MIIAVDIDLTVCDVTKGWYTWLEKVCIGKVNGKNYEEDYINGCVEYNLSEYFHLPEDVDPMDYWRASDLYDDIPMYESAFLVLNRLAEEHDIVFVSYCKTGHSKSKFNMVKRNVPKMKGFISTKEKNFVKCDISIDDRNSFCNMYDKDVVKFKMNTPFLQDEDLEDEGSVHHVDNMYEFEEILEEILS